MSVLPAPRLEDTPGHTGEGVTAPWPGRWLPTGAAPIAHRWHHPSTSDALQKQRQPLDTASHDPRRHRPTLGGFPPPSRPSQMPASKGVGSRAPPGQRGSPSPLHALAVRPGIPAHSPELSSAGRWGRQQPSVPHPGANPRPLLKPPSTLQSPPHRAPGWGGDTHTTHPTSPSPSHLLPWLGEGPGLAAAPARARGIRALFTAEIRVLFKEHANQSEQTAWALPAAAAAV